MVIYSHREAVPVEIKKENAEVVKPVEEPKVEEPIVEVEEPIVEVEETIEEVKVEEPIIETEEPVNKKYNNKKK